MNAQGLTVFYSIMICEYDDSSRYPTSWVNREYHDRN